MTIKATPGLIVQGFNDQSTVAQTVQPENIPQHLAYCPILAERGGTMPYLAIGDGATRTYGAKTFDPNSPFATHQTLLLTKLFAEGNIALVQRVVPAGATTAMLRLSLEVIPTEIPVFVRGSDGSISYTNNGSGGYDPQVSSTIVGHRLVWHTKVDAYLPANRALGQGTVVENYRSGSITAAGKTLGEIDGTPTQSTLYPIMDLEVSGPGSYGNNIGIRLSAPNAVSTQPQDISMTEAVRAYIYRLTCVERSSSSSVNPPPTRTNGDDLSLSVVLKENVNNPRTNLPMSMADVFIDSYQELDNADGTPPKFGPFGKQHLYTANLNAVLTLLTQGDANAAEPVLGEKDFDADAFSFGRMLGFADVTNKHLLNIFTGVDYNNVPYYSFDVANSTLFGGITLNSEAAVYATGGNDGLVYDTNGRPDVDANLELYDELAKEAFSNFGYGEAKLLDMARYPISAVWDSGFSLDTKKSMLTVMARRKDVTAYLATHSIADYIPSTAPGNVNGKIWLRMGANDESTEQAIATSLKNVALLTPESIIFGTPACRAAIIGHSGELLEKAWRGRYPLTIEVAAKVAKYMGQSDGNYSRGDSFDEESGNRVTLFKTSTVNLTYKDTSNYDKSWENGIIWVQYADSRTLFFPAFQTVYPDSSSIFNALVVVNGAAELVKVAHRVWTRLVGNSRLTPEQFKARSDELIVALTNGRFDDRFTITPKTTLTKADEERAYSWSTEITISGSTLRTVNTLTITGRREDFQSAA